MPDKHSFIEVWRSPMSSDVLNLSSGYTPITAGLGSKLTVQVEGGITGGYKYLDQEGLIFDLENGTTYGSVTWENRLGARKQDADALGAAAWVGYIYSQTAPTLDITTGEGLEINWQEVADKIYEVTILYTRAEDTTKAQLAATLIITDKDGVEQRLSGDKLVLASSALNAQRIADGAPVELAEGTNDNYVKLFTLNRTQGADSEISFQLGRANTASRDDFNYGEDYEIFYVVPNGKPTNINERGEFTTGEGIELGKGEVGTLTWSKDHGLEVDVWAKIKSDTDAEQSEGINLSIWGGDPGELTYQTSFQAGDDNSAYASSSERSSQYIGVKAKGQTKTNNNFASYLGGDSTRPYGQGGLFQLQRNLDGKGARIEFDVLLAESWDGGEQLKVNLNGNILSINRGESFEDKDFGNGYKGSVANYPGPGSFVDSTGLWQDRVFRRSSAGEIAYGTVVSNLEYTLVFQQDGNLVLYENDTDGNRTTRAPWASNTYNNPGARLFFQDDGNLVIYKQNGPLSAKNLVWSSGYSGQAGSGAYELVLGTAGPIAAFSRINGQMLWRNGAGGQTVAGTNSTWASDRAARIVLDVPAGETAASLQVSSTLDQKWGDENWTIDNLYIYEPEVTTYTIKSVDNDPIVRLGSVGYLDDSGQFVQSGEEDTIREGRINAVEVLVVDSNGNSASVAKEGGIRVKYKIDAGNSTASKGSDYFQSSYKNDAYTDAAAEDYIFIPQSSDRGYIYLTAPADAIVEAGETISLTLEEVDRVTDSNETYKDYSVQTGLTSSRTLQLKDAANSPWKEEVAFTQQGRTDDYIRANKQGEVVIDVRLRSQPSTDVKIPVSITDIGYKEVFTFTVENWNQAQQTQKLNIGDREGHVTISSSEPTWTGTASINTFTNPSVAAVVLYEDGDYISEDAKIAISGTGSVLEGDGRELVYNFNFIKAGGETTEHAIPVFFKTAALTDNDQAKRTLVFTDGDNVKSYRPVELRTSDAYVKWNPLSLGAPAHSYTVALWIKPSSLSTQPDNTVVSVQSTGVGDKQLSVGNDGTVQWTTSSGAAISSSLDVVGEQVLTDQWNHIAASFDATNNTHTIFLNGKAIASEEGTDDPIAADSVIWLGKGFIGEARDLRILDGSLTGDDADNIHALMAGQSLADGSVLFTAALNGFNDRNPAVGLAAKKADGSIIQYSSGQLDWAADALHQVTIDAGKKQASVNISNEDDQIANGETEIGLTLETSTLYEVIGSGETVQSINDDDKKGLSLYQLGEIQSYKIAQVGTLDDQGVSVAAVDDALVPFTKAIRNNANSSYVLSVPNGTGAAGNHTFATWLKLENEFSGRIASVSDTKAGTVVEISQLADGTLEIGVSASGSRDTYQSTEQISHDKWQHLAVGLGRPSESESQVNAHLNGVELTLSKALADNTAAANLDGLAVDAISLGGGSKGMDITGLKIYNSLRSASDIEQDRNKTAITLEPDLWLALDTKDQKVGDPGSGVPIIGTVVSILPKWQAINESLVLEANGYATVDSDGTETNRQFDETGNVVGGVDYLVAAVQPSQTTLGLALSSLPTGKVRVTLDEIAIEGLGTYVSIETATGVAFEEFVFDEQNWDQPQTLIITADGETPASAITEKISFQVTSPLADGYDSAYQNVALSQTLNITPGAISETVADVVALDIKTDTRAQFTASFTEDTLNKSLSIKEETTRFGARVDIGITPSNEQAQRSGETIVWLGMPTERGSQYADIEIDLAQSDVLSGAEFITGKNYSEASSTILNSLSGIGAPQEGGTVLTYLVIPESGFYHFKASAHSAYSLQIDGITRLKQETATTSRKAQTSSPIAFKAGDYVPLEITLDEHSLGDERKFTLKWSSPSNPESFTPISSLSRASAPHVVIQADSSKGSIVLNAIDDQVAEETVTSQKIVIDPEKTYNIVFSQASAGPGNTQVGFTDLDGGSASRVLLPEQAKNESGTITFWVKPDGLDKTQSLFDAGSPTPLKTNTNRIRLQAGTKGEVVLDTWNKDGDRVVKNLSTEDGALKASEWNHIAITTSGTAQKIWINGVEKAQREFKPINLEQSRSIVSLGANLDLSNPLSGGVYGYQVFEEELNGSTLQDLSNRLPAAGSEALGPVQSFGLDQSESGVVNTGTFKTEFLPLSQGFVNRIQGLGYEGGPTTSLALSAGDVLTFMPEGGSEGDVVSITLADDVILRNGIYLNDIAIQEISSDQASKSGYTTEYSQFAYSLPEKSGADGALDLEQVKATISVLDNDTAGFIWTSASKTQLLEGDNSASARITQGIRLSSKPTEAVTVYIQADSNDYLRLYQLDSTGEASDADVVYLTFTPANWNQSQNFILEAKDNDIVDGLRTSKIHATTASSDPRYHKHSTVGDNAQFKPLSFSIQDDDKAGIFIVSVDNNINATENGFVAVSLNSQPNGLVQVTATPSDQQFTLNGRSINKQETLLFSPSNWNVPQSLELIAVSDTTPEATTQSSINWSFESSLASDQANYGSALTVDPLSVYIIDDDIRTASIVPVFNAQEGGSPAMFKIVLDQPAADDPGSTGTMVEYQITGFDVDLGGNLPTGLASLLNRFTQNSYTVNANAGTSTTYTLKDDFLSDGRSLGNLDWSDQTWQNETSTTGTLIAQGKDAWRELPKGVDWTKATDVSLSFTKSNKKLLWIKLYKVKDGSVVDEVGLYRYDKNSAETETISTSTDKDGIDIKTYVQQGFNAIGIQGDSDGNSYIDDLELSITVDSATISGYALIAPGEQESKQFVIPIDDAAVDLLSLDAANKGKRVSITLADTDSKSYEVSSSANTVSVDIIDDDKAGIAIIRSGDYVTVKEDGGGDSFFVVLLSQPSNDVTISITESRGQEGNTLTGDDGDNQTNEAELEAFSALTFTSSNWSTPQAVTLTAKQDKVIEDGSTSGYTGTGIHSTKVGFGFDSDDTNYSKVDNTADTEHFTQNTSLDILIEDATLSPDTVNALSSSFDALQQQFDAIELPILGRLEGKNGDYFSGLIRNIIPKLEKLKDDLSPKRLDQFVKDNINKDSSVEMVGNEVVLALGFSENINLGRVPLDSSIGIPGLGMQTDGSVGATINLGGQAKLALSFSTGDGSADVELLIGEDDTYFDAGVALDVDGLSVAGGLGFLQFDATDQASGRLSDQNAGTGMDAGVNVNFGGGKDSAGNPITRLGYADLAGVSSSISSYLQTTFTGEAALSLGVNTGLSGGASLPSLNFDLALPIDLTNPKGSTVYFDNINLDIGTFATKMLLPALEVVGDVLDPIRPLADAFYTDTKIFGAIGMEDAMDDDGDGKVTPIDMLVVFANQFGSKQDQQKAASAKVFLSTVQSIYGTIDNFKALAKGDAFTIPLGDYEFSLDTSPESTETASGKTIDAASSSSLDRNLGATRKSEANKATDNSSVKKFNNAVESLYSLGFTLPLLEDPSTAISLLMGKDVDLFTWSVPGLSASVAPSATFQLWPAPLIEGTVGGTFGADAFLTLGFDTSGFSDWAQRGFDLAESWRALDGFFVSDWDADGNDIDEVSVSAGLGVEVSATVPMARAAVGGGVEAVLGFDLIDIGEFNGSSDGKLRASEIFSRISNPLSLFQMSGDLSAYLEGSIKLGADLGLFEKWWTVWREQVDVELFSFELKASGTSSNGPLAGATIFFDANLNNQIDPGEASTTTDQFGRYDDLSIDLRGVDKNLNGEIDPEEGRLISFGGTDTVGDITSAFVLTAPYGSQITPLTTLYSAALGAGILPDDAISLINRAFGIEGWDFVNKDPITILRDENSSNEDKLLAQPAALAQVLLGLSLNFLMDYAATAESDDFSLTLKQKIDLVDKHALAFVNSYASDLDSKNLGSHLITALETVVNDLRQKNPVFKDASEYSSVLLRELNDILSGIETSKPTDFIKAIDDQFDSGMTGLLVGAIKSGDMTAFEKAVGSIKKYLHKQGLFNSSPQGKIGILGSPTGVGSVLTATLGSLSDIGGLPSTDPSDPLFQWSWYAHLGTNDPTLLDEQTGPELQLDEALFEQLKGQRLSVRLTYGDEQDAEAALSSLLTSVVGAANQSAEGNLRIEGSLRQGSIVRAIVDGLSDASNPDGAVDSDSLTFQWAINGQTLDMASSDSLILTQAHVGQALSVSASFIDADGFAETITSSLSSPIRNVNDAPRGRITVDGLPVIDNLLTATATNLFDVDNITADNRTGAVPDASISYQWLADGQAITGATSNTLSLGSSLINRTISARAVYTDSLGATESILSTSTAPVVAAIPSAPPLLLPPLENQSDPDNLSFNLAVRDGSVRVTTLRADRPVTWSLSSGGVSDSPLFNVNPSTGTLSFARPASADASPEGGYQLDVEAKDSFGLTSNAAVKIRVLESNPNDPDKPLEFSDNRLAALVNQFSPQLDSTDLNNDGVSDATQTNVAISAWGTRDNYASEQPTTAVVITASAGDSDSAAQSSVHLEDVSVLDTLDVPDSLTSEPSSGTSTTVDVTTVLDPLAFTLASVDPVTQQPSDRFIDLAPPVEIDGQELDLYPGDQVRTTIDFADGIAANSYLKYNPALSGGAGGWVEFMADNDLETYDNGAQFIDLNGDGLIDRVVLTFTDGDPDGGDMDGIVNGIILDPGVLATVTQRDTGAPSSGGSSSATSSSSLPAAAPTDSIADGTIVEHADADGDGFREVIIAADGYGVDGNRDGILDAEQTQVVALNLINDASKHSDYGALAVSDNVALRGVTLLPTADDGSIAVTLADGSSVNASLPSGITNTFSNAIAFELAGLTPGGTAEALIYLPAGYNSDGNAYIRYNYETQRFEDYRDAEGNRLYAFTDTDGDGFADAISLTLTDGDAQWDGDGLVNGSVIDPGFLASGAIEIRGDGGKNRLTGNILANQIRGKGERDVLIGDLGDDILRGGRGDDRLHGGEGADVLIGGGGADRFIYRALIESSVERSDTIQLNQRDRIDLHHLDANTRRKGNQSFRFVAEAEFSGKAGELRLFESRLLADVDGDRQADFALNLHSNQAFSADVLRL